jgi:acyl-CoA synthetase (AMP-forming)/AMP-acid ligase II
MSGMLRCAEAWGQARAVSLRQLVADRAEAAPDSPALLAPGRPPLSYRGLLRQVEEGIGALSRHGIGPGDPVAVVLPNGPEMASLFLTVAAGAVCGPLNPAYRDTEFDFYLSDLQARALILGAGSDSPARAVAIARGIPVIELSPHADGEAGRFTLQCPPGLAAAPPRRAEPDGVALVLHTSGTTSRPKRVPLTHRNLCSSAEHVRTALALTESDRCLNVMPLFHIHGLVAAVLASLAAGASVVCTPGFHAIRFFEWMEECRPTWYSAVPSMHQSILSRASEHRELIDGYPLRLIRSASAPLPPPVLSALEGTFGAPVIEAYGMTEAAHQITSNPLPAERDPERRPRKPGSVGLAAGPEVAVQGDGGRPLQAGERGEIVIRGPSVMAGYENNEAANREAFRDGWLRTGDEGYVDEEGYLYLTGRLKEIINRGGEKISPREVDEVLLEHPAVAQAVTFALPHPVLGEDVGAAVVLREWGAVNGADLRRFAAARLAHFKVPREILVLEELPKGPTGKLQRIGLAERLGLTAPLGPSTIGGTYSPPGTPLEHGLCEIWQQVLGIPQIGVHDNFLALGGHSLLATQAISRIRQTLHVEVALSLFLQIPTVAELAEAIVLLQTGESRPLRNA